MKNNKIFSINIGGKKKKRTDEDKKKDLEKYRGKTPKEMKDILFSNEGSDEFKEMMKEKDDIDKMLEDNPKLLMGLLQYGVNIISAIKDSEEAFGRKITPVEIVHALSLFLEKLEKEGLIKIIKKGVDK